MFWQPLVAALCAAPALATVPLDDLEIVQPSYVGHVVLADTVRVELTAKVRNNGSGTFSGVGASFGAGTPLAVPDGWLDVGDVPPNATVSTADTVTVDVPKGRAQDFIAWVKTGKPWTLSGVEDPVFHVGTIPYDAASDAAFDSESDNGNETWTLAFTTATPLLSGLAGGDIVVYDGSFALALTPSRRLPFEVVSPLTQNGAVYELVVTPPDLAGAYWSGTFEAGSWNFEPSFYESQSPAEYAAFTNMCTEDPETPVPECAWQGLHIPFEDVEIAPGVLLNGAILLDASVFDLVVRIRDGSVEELSATFSLAESADLELSASISADFPRQQVQIWWVSLPGLIANIGGIPVTITPEVTVFVGAEGVVHAETVASLYQQAGYEVQLGWESGVGLGATSETTDPVLELTAPRLTDDTQASARVFSVVEVTVKLNYATGPSFSLEPYLALDLEPTQDPWWSAQAGVVLGGAMEIGVLGMNIARIDSPPVDVPLASWGAQPAAPHTDPAEALRWSTVYDVSPLAGDSDASYDMAALPSAEAVTTSGSYGDSRVVRTDPLGAVVYGSEVVDRTLRPALLTDGTAIVGGTFTTGAHPVSVMELDPTGQKVWESAWDLGAYAVSAHAFHPASPDGVDGFVLVGELREQLLDDPLPLVVRFDRQGNVLWARTYGSVSGSLHDIDRTPDGGWLAVGGTDVPIGGFEPFYNDANHGLALRLDDAGDLVWATVAGTYRSEVYHAVHVRSDGSAALCGTLSRSISQQVDAFWMGVATPTGSVGSFTLAEHLDWIGQPNPGDVLGDGMQDRCDALTTGPDGDVLVAGRTQAGSSSNAWIGRVDFDDGRTAWFRTFEGMDDGELLSIADVGDSILVFGATRAFTPYGVGGDRDAWITRLAYGGSHVFADPGAGADAWFTMPQLQGTPAFNVLGEQFYAQADAAPQLAPTDRVPVAVPGDAVVTAIPVTAVEVSRP